MTDPVHPLTPLERLHLREALQDRWRGEVRRITELSVVLHTAFEDSDADGDIDAAAVAVAVAVSESRLRLLEIEQAMRRLDDRSYGRCFGCLDRLPFTDLADEPERRHCGDCRHAGATRPVAATAGVG
jgi:hypothetical protein